MWIEWGPLAVKTYPGAAWVPSDLRATFDPDYGRRGLLWVHGALRVREWYSPVVRELLQKVVASGQEVRLIIDGTQVGGGHRLLMVAVAYRRRSLPIVWTWVKGSRGHSLATTPCALFAYIRTLLPEGRASWSWGIVSLARST